VWFKVNDLPFYTMGNSTYLSLRKESLWKRYGLVKYSRQVNREGRRDITEPKENAPAQATPPRFDAVASVLFAVKAATAAVLAYLIYTWLKLPGAAWAAPVSAVLVTQPTFQPSIQASIARFWANLLGALIGSAAVLLLGPTPWALGVAVVLAGFLCQAIRLDEGLRPAYVSVVIVIFTGGEQVWAGSFDRVLAVFVGCLVALVVGALCDLPLQHLVERLHRHFGIRVPFGKPVESSDLKGRYGPKNAQE